MSRAPTPPLGSTVFGNLGHTFQKQTQKPLRRGVQCARARRSVLFSRMVVGDTEDFLRGRPVSLTNLYKEEHRTHDEYQFRIKDKVRSGAPARKAAPLPLRSRAR